MARFTILMGGRCAVDGKGVGRLHRSTESAGPRGERRRIILLSTGDSIDTSIPLCSDIAPRVQVTVRCGDKSAAEVECRRVVTLFGSRDGCKVVLRHRRIAPAHLAIVNDGVRVRVVDLSTSSGCTLNGLRLDTEVLADGDAIGIDPWELLVRLGQPPPRAAGADEHAFNLDPTPHAFALEHLPSQRILQPTRDVCIIGRRSSCDITLSDDRVSRVHAMLVMFQGHPAVVDLLSTHGVQVNDKPVSFRILDDEDLLSLGHSRFRVRIVGSQVGKTPKNGESAGQETPKIITAAVDDQIDIANVEGSQRWHIADHAEKTARTA